jgi:tetratricopeptide (TPR) repeat protein
MPFELEGVRNKLMSIRGRFACVALGAVLLRTMTVCAETPKLPIAVYVLEFQTNIIGDNRTVAHDLSLALETAVSKRRSQFRLLERKSLNEIVSQHKMEKELQSLSRGEKPSQQFIQQLSGADGVVRGEVRENRLDGVVVTISLTRLNTEKLWQGQRRHTLYEWLNGDIRDKEAESLAAEASAALAPEPVAVTAGEDGIRGLEFAQKGDCKEATPLLQNAVAIDGNAEHYLWLGRCQTTLGERTAAMHSFTAGIARNSKRADLFTERARSLAGQGLYARSLEDLDRALDRDSRYMPAVELRGDVFFRLGRYPEAISAFNEAYQHTPSRENCSKLAEAYQKNGVSALAATMKSGCASLP